MPRHYANLIYITVVDFIRPEMILWREPICLPAAAIGRWVDEQVDYAFMRT